MMNKFKIGDRVTWNSEAGRVSGTIIKVHTRNVAFKGWSETLMNATAAANDIRCRTEGPAFALGEQCQGRRPARPYFHVEAVLPIREIPY